MRIGPIVAAAAWLHRVPVARRLAIWMAIIAVYATLVSIAGSLIDGISLHFEPDLHTFAGFILGLLLVFRTNTAYERWWEARKLWGQLVNDSRNLAVKVTRLIRVSPTEARDFGQLITDFARSLRDHLQDARVLTIGSNSEISQPGTPTEYVELLYDKLKGWSEANQLNGFETLTLDVHLRTFLDILGGCDRIRKTPISLSYRAFVRQCVFLYLITLPWCLIHSYGIWTVPATIIISYFMIGIEVIAETVEQPFGQSDDHISLDEICDGIEKSMGSILCSNAGPRPANVLSQ